MTACPSSTAEDGRPLDVKVVAFLSDRTVGAVTGPRRMPRSEMVEYVGRVAEVMGLAVSTGRSADRPDPDILLFDHWRDVDDALVSRHPGADVLCGQDLCHQVPAVMRLNRSTRRNG